MSTDFSKIFACIGTLLLLAIAMVWAQNECTGTKPSFICRGNENYQDCLMEGDINTPYGNNQICSQNALGQKRLCSMKCPLSCSGPDETCLALGTTCHSKGYMANPNNCREYYVCYLTGTTYTRYNYTCNGYFDAGVNRCSNSVTVCEERPVHTV